MGQLKINLKNSYNSPSAIKNVENKLLLGGDNHRLIMFIGVKITVEDEIYGRRHKVRKVKYLHCTVKGWNENGEFVGEYDQENIEFFLMHRDLGKMRRAYIDFKKQYDAMLALEERVNEPIKEG